jgi:peptidoglycan-N-acetylglucosamine deacetylase
VLMILDIVGFIVYTGPFAAAALIAGSLWYYLAPWLHRQYSTHRIRSTVIRHRLLALTYDDGPSTELTPRLLDLLRRRGACATFFIVSQHAQEHPEIVDRILREGHSIACHSDRHINAWKSGPMAAVADIEAGFRNLSPWIRPGAIFRPPNGKLTAITWAWLWYRKARVIWWTVDSGDTKKDLPRADEIAAAVRREGGAIVLMHDLNRSTTRNEFVLEVTSALLDLAESESLQVLPLTEIRV